ncbi:leucine-rich repeat serine/threonine-protein kinase 1-like [Nilaparvata lugens]|uniref:leucine-rich repeat serine/threonine-protein kinase 1-like n=1 Tax=Nilaparvata lugens TaxID=108931 RepID=UPI00193CE5B4|nr:leucine-rich repeat serine/threonine-protein kinase 1-like [Nilaparvata lugens]
MVRWTPQHRAYAVKALHQNGSSYQLARRAFRNHFNINRNQPVPSACAIKDWVKNFEETASTTRKKTGRPKTVRTPENVERVRVAIDRSPRRSARRHSVTLGISNRTVRRILHQDLHFHPYKIQMVQALKETDFVSRSRFSLEFLDLINEDEDIVNRLWMSDEAHFHLSGYVNKQNFRFWSDVNPRELHQQPLHSKKLLSHHNVWSRSVEVTEQILHPEHDASEDCSQLSSLNLAHNQFTSVPVVLSCLAVNLTRLNLSYNSLRSMSHITSYPSSLKQLDLSHNQVCCWPSLPQIETTDTMEQAAVTCYAPELNAKPIKLSASARRPGRSLRTTILNSLCVHRRHFRLENLRTLVLADNKITRIQLSTDDDGYSSQESEDTDNEWIAFQNWFSLNFFSSSNKYRVAHKSVDACNFQEISELPPHMGLLSRLWNLNTRGCNLQEPLKSMIESKKYKTMDIIGYLKSVLEDARPYARIKLMIVGVQGIGKTSLLEQLRQEGSGSYRKKPVEHWAKRMGNKNINVKTSRGTNMSTVGVDIGDWVYEKKIRGQSSHGPCVFRTWDFGGQREYYATHQYFLSKRSLYLVVWRIPDGQKGISEIMQWLVNIQEAEMECTHHSDLYETFKTTSSAQKAEICGDDYLLTAYHSLFHSQITYGILIWGHALTASDVLLLQEKAIRT